FVYLCYFILCYFVSGAHSEDQVTQSHDSQRVSEGESVQINCRYQTSSMENLSTLEGLKDVAAKHCNFLHVAGCYCYLQNLQDRDVLVQDFMKWYVCGRTRNSLERLKEGLKMLGVLDAIVAYPVLFANSFCWRDTAGSNKRREEQRIVGYWRDYLQDVEVKDNVLAAMWKGCWVIAADKVDMV
ncbi:G2/M phase-specific E3 ubiquitin-protein ligase, partial [Acipenser ruthenus]